MKIGRRFCRVAAAPLRLQTDSRLHLASFTNSVCIIELQLQSFGLCAAAGCSARVLTGGATCWRWPSALPWCCCCGHGSPACRPPPTPTSGGWLPSCTMPRPATCPQMSTARSTWCPRSCTRPGRPARCLRSGRRRGSHALTCTPTTSSASGPTPTACSSSRYAVLGRLRPRAAMLAGGMGKRARAVVGG